MVWIRLLFWKKNSLQPSVHKGYIATELLIAIVILGISFALLWKIYGQRINGNAFDEKSIYQAQDMMQNAISSKSYQNDFSIVSKNGHIYQGVAIEISVQNIGYKYFSPTTMQK